MEEGWVYDRMVITPSTAASTTALARKVIAIRSRMPRATTGIPPRQSGRVGALPVSIDTHERLRVPDRTEIGWLEGIGAA